MLFIPNGAVVYDRCKGKNLYTNYIPSYIVENIWLIFLKAILFIGELYANGASNTQESKAAFSKNKDLPPNFLISICKVRINHDNLSEFCKRITISKKINLFYFDGEYYDEIKGISCLAIENIDRTSPVSGDIEMTYKGVNKGVALDNMCKELCFTPDEVMSFGDADNDIEMLPVCRLWNCYG